MTRPLTALLIASAAFGCAQRADRPGSVQVHRFESEGQILELTILRGEDLRVEQVELALWDGAYEWVEVVESDPTDGYVEHVDPTAEADRRLHELLEPAEPVDPAAQADRTLVDLLEAADPEMVHQVYITLVIRKAVENAVPLTEDTSVVPRDALGVIGEAIENMGGEHVSAAVTDDHDWGLDTDDLPPPRDGN